MIAAREFIVSPGPHLSRGISVNRIMYLVVLALLLPSCTFRRDDVETTPVPAEVDPAPQIVEEVEEVEAADEVIAYAVRIAEGTRQHPRLALGASPRATVQLVRLAQARAALDGRSFVLPDDVKALAHAALVHRLGGGRDGTGTPGVTKEIVSAVLKETPVRG